MHVYQKKSVNETISFVKYWLKLSGCAYGRLLISFTMLTFICIQKVYVYMYKKNSKKIHENRASIETKGFVFVYLLLLARDREKSSPRKTTNSIQQKAYFVFSIEPFHFHSLLISTQRKEKQTHVQRDGVCLK